MSCRPFSLFPMLSLRDFDFELPQELIAQYPLEERDKARLMVVFREPFRIEHRIFRNLPEYLRPGDVLVLNMTRVIKARLFARRADTGGKVELLITRKLEGRRFEALATPGRRARPGTLLRVGNFRLKVLDRMPEGRRMVELLDEVDPDRFLEEAGVPPLPPYIKRPPMPRDEEWYQTVYARVSGSIAAPTAGLHFTPRLLQELEAQGVIIRYLVLHVGVGTFQPVRTEDVTQHQMEAEYYEIPPETQNAVREAKAEGRRVILVGTTVTRAMETWALGEGPASGWTSLFIYPGYRFRVLDGLITNFHLPRSTPLLLVAALLGRENLLRAYREAIAQRYRFFSYGDAMLIL